MRKLQPALVAISGGAGDIAHAIAVALHEAGAQIALADVAPPPVSPSSPPFYYKPLDVTDDVAVEQWYAGV